MSLSHYIEAEKTKDLSILKEILGAEDSFFFETINENSSEIKIITAAKPIQKFRSLDELDGFIKNHGDKYKNTDAGMAGYINYEGALEFAFYEKIHELNLKQEDLKSLLMPYQDKETKYKIITPDSDEFINNVKKAQEYISEGDIYQANITRKFLIENQKEPFLNKQAKANFKSQKIGLNIYSKLRKANPAPYCGYLNFEDYEIISSSPESFLKIYSEGSKLKISSSPIKGTADLENRNFLINSKKDKAEHIMIVDLVRNDLGRICKTGSIEVGEMLGIYQFKNLFHYISTVSGDLKDKLSFKEIFEACFPGGSITGAPKIRAMEIIKELEPVERGPYTGSMGYMKYNGEHLKAEFNILIRTIVINKKKNEASFHSGGGITAYSDPKLELEESNLKAEKLIDALNT